MPRNPSKIMTGQPKKVEKNLHKFISQGGKPKDFEGAQGVNTTTVPGYKGCKCRGPQGCTCK